MNCTKCDQKSSTKGMCKRHYNQWYRTEHAEKRKVLKREWQQNHKKELKEYIQNYVSENRDKINTRRRATRNDKIRYNTDLNFKMKNILRKRLGIALKNNQKTGSTVKDLGCSIEELKTYLESLWQPGMSWDNWTINGWHIDHIIPLSSFDLTDYKQLLKACHYSNLQPMWAKDNLAKGAK